MAFARLGNLLGRTTSFLLCSFVASSCGLAQAQIDVSRGATTILVEPYAPNIVRVSMSLRKMDALAAPGYGITAQPNYATGSEVQIEAETFFDPAFSRSRSLLSATLEDIQPRSRCFPALRITWASTSPL